MFRKQPEPPTRSRLTMTDFSSPAGGQYLSFQSVTLHITNRLVVDRAETTSIATVINADLLAPSQQLWAFKDGVLQGVIEKLSISITEASSRECWASVHLQDELFEHAWLHLNILLLPAEFKELFHPIWIRQAHSQLRLSLQVTGHHIPIEAAFSEIGDIANSAFEAEKRLPAALGTIEVTTAISNTAPFLASRNARGA